MQLLTAMSGAGGFDRGAIHVSDRTELLRRGTGTWLAAFTSPPARPGRNAHAPPRRSTCVKFWSALFPDRCGLF